MLDGDKHGGTTTPLFVTPVPRFFKYLKVLVKIFEIDLHPIVIIKFTSYLVIAYGFLTLLDRFLIAHYW